MNMLIDVICSQSLEARTESEIKNRTKDIIPKNLRSKVGDAFKSAVSKGRLVDAKEGMFKAEAISDDFSPIIENSDTSNLKNYLLLRIGESFNIKMIEALFPHMIYGSIHTVLQKWTGIGALACDSGIYMTKPELGDVNVRSNKGNSTRGIEKPRKKSTSKGKLVSTPQGSTALEGILLLEAENKKLRRIIEKFYALLAEEGLIGEEDEEDNM